MYNWNFIEFRSPEDSNTGVVPDETPNLENMTDEEILNADNEELGLEVDESENEEEQEESDTDDNENVDDSEETEESNEDNNEEENEEQEEEEDSAAPRSVEETTFRDVKAKYPNLFKEFPALKVAFAESKQYKEVFATPAEARQVREQYEQYDTLAQELDLGSPVGLVVNLAENNPEALQSFAQKILPVLHRVDQNLFLEATLPVLATVLNNVTKQYAERARNENDQEARNYYLAARYISKFVFNQAEPPDFRQNKSSTPDPEKAHLLAKHNQHLQERLQESAVLVNGNITKELNRAIQPHLKKYLNGQSDYVVNKARVDIIKAIDAEVCKDGNFMRSQAQLWDRAKRTDYRDKAVLSRIESAYRERANKVAASVVKRVLTSAKLINGKQSPKSKKVGSQNTFSQSGNRSRANTQNIRNINPRQVDWRQTSDMDVLNDNIKVRGAK